MVLDFLPQQNKCCFSSNLRVGTIIIGVVGLLHAESFVHLSDPFRYKHVLYCDNEAFRKSTVGFIYVEIICEICLLIVSIVLLISVFTKKTVLAIIYIYTVITVVLFLGLIVLPCIMIIGGVHHCGPGWNIIMALVYFGMEVYFVIVVSSYVNQMEDDLTEEEEEPAEERPRKKRKRKKTNV